jgi:CHASE2 domain-containing sensor protein
MEFIKSVLKNRNLLSIFISFIVFILVFALSSSNSLYFLNKKIQNSYYSIFNKIKSEYKNEKILSNDIIVVEIDDKTLQE